MLARMSVIVGCLLLAACAQTPNRVSYTMADASRYQHLYQTMENGAYDHPAFFWLDKKPLNIKDDD